MEGYCSTGQSPQQAVVQQQQQQQQQQERSLQNSPLESSCVVVALIENKLQHFKTFKSFSWGGGGGTDFEL
jgi:hypothetical protein